MAESQENNIAAAGVGRARLPEWVKTTVTGATEGLHEMKSILRRRGLNTVCEEARCPNIGECFTKPTATFMILGGVCTRTCGFCSVESLAKPHKLDPEEPLKIALTAKELNLKHVVVTSVTRDDLQDGGAGHFALTIKALRDHVEGIRIEVLTPDFKGKIHSIDAVLKAGPDIFNHNLETVPRLYDKVRPQAGYVQSLEVLLRGNDYTLPGTFTSQGGVSQDEGAPSTTYTKSGIMVGLGETKDEVKELLQDLRAVGCDIVTIGQYLQPTRKNLDVVEYVRPEVFKEYEEYGLGLGIPHVYSGPMVRSSYNAEKIFEGREA